MYNLSNAHFYHRYLLKYVFIAFKYISHIINTNDRQFQCVAYLTLHQYLFWFLGYNVNI